MADPVREHGISGLGLFAQDNAPEAVEPSLYNDVNIKKVSNGFIVAVGCKRFVARTWAEVSEGLAMYWDNPRGARKKYAEDEQITLTVKEPNNGLLGNRRGKKRSPRKHIIKRRRPGSHSSG